MGRTSLGLAFVVMVGLACSEPAVEVAPPSITFEPEAVLGRDDADYSPHFTALVAEGLGDQPGYPRFVVAPTFEDGVLHGYDSDGTIVARFGGPGEGPGEFGGQSFSAFLGDEDRLWVASRRSGRLVSLTVDGDVRVVPVFPWPLRALAPLDDSTFAALPLPSEVGPVIVKRTGEYDELSLPVESSGGLMLGQSARNGEALLSTAAGEILRVSDEGIESLFSVLFAAPDTQEDAGPPRVSGLWGEEDVIWILITRERQAPEPGTPFGPGLADQLFDTRVLAVDRDSGEIIATGDSENAYLPVAGPSGFVSRVFETDLGDTRIEIVRLGLTGGITR